MRCGHEQNERCRARSVCWAPARRCSPPKGSVAGGLASNSIHLSWSSLNDGLACDARGTQGETRFVLPGQNRLRCYGRRVAVQTRLRPTSAPKALGSPGSLSGSSTSDSHFQSITQRPRFPLGLTSFEAVFRNACSHVGWTCDAAQFGHPALCGPLRARWLRVAQRHLSLKSTAAKSISPTVVLISKLTEAAWIQDTRTRTAQTAGHA